MVPALVHAEPELGIVPELEVLQRPPEDLEQPHPRLLHHLLTEAVQQNLGTAVNELEQFF